MNTEFRSIFKEGIWSNNVVMAQMLALCPLLAVTSSATNGLGMGIASTVVMITSGLIVSITRHLIAQEVRIPVFVLLIATIVTLVDLFMNAWLHELYKVLGLFIPLIVTNCAILGRAESFASRKDVVSSVFDGLSMGLGFTFILIALGAVREILGSGRLFTNASLLLGEKFSFLETVLFEHYGGFLIMILPPGGFLALGFILAAKKIIDKRKTKEHKKDPLINEPDLEPAMES